MQNKEHKHFLQANKHFNVGLMFRFRETEYTVTNMFTDASDIDFYDKTFSETTQGGGVQKQKATFAL